MLEDLESLAERVDLSPLHRVLLTTDGSITRLLEAVELSPIAVEAVLQEVVKAPREVAELLGIREGEEVNHRVVNLRSCRGVLVRATSFAALARLEPEFRRQVMMAEKPIGRIMAELQVESRREILGFSCFRADSELARVFGMKEGTLMLERRYLILCRSLPLIYIVERFPHELF
ncbi:chorismate--pyruvate lyase family protein [Candidatus Pyrohabitans sp.]